ncbi:MAG TPA: hypothetical protein VLN90_00730 [Thioalkalivibrio sp.]|nr:hypothetical protein [Thioalkalivibrio sp.]
MAGLQRPRFLAGRHGIDDRNETVQAMTKALNALTDAAIAQ